MACDLSCDCSREVLVALLVDHDILKVIIPRCYLEQDLLQLYIFVVLQCLQDAFGFQ